MVRIVMSWNIKAEEESAYFEFVVQEFVPGIMKMGIRPTEAWYTVYGEGPQIITSGVAADRETVDKAFSSEEWKGLRAKLQTFVTDFKQRVTLQKD
jgi:hypothetical protein